MAKVKFSLASCSCTLYALFLIDLSNSNSIFFNLFRGSVESIWIKMSLLAILWSIWSVILYFYSLIIYWDGIDWSLKSLSSYINRLNWISAAFLNWYFYVWICIEISKRYIPTFRKPFLANENRLLYNDINSNTTACR